jgi:hypothetical protein
MRSPQSEQISPVTPAQHPQHRATDEKRPDLINSPLRTERRRHVAPASSPDGIGIGLNGAEGPTL